MTNKTGWFNKNKLGNSPKYESYRHSLASKGIKTASPKGVRTITHIAGQPTPNFDMVAKGQTKRNIPLYIADYFIEGKNVSLEKIKGRYIELNTSRFGYKTSEFIDLDRFIRTKEISEIYDKLDWIHSNSGMLSQKVSKIISNVEKPIKKTDMVSGREISKTYKPTTIQKRLLNIDDLNRFWGSGKNVTIKGKKYKIGKMSYGNWFLTPIGIKWTELDSHSPNTLWLVKSDRNPYFYDFE